ncbi:head-tail connector protein [Wolbachia endosymbiont of Dactylopius coccus]
MGIGIRYYFSNVGSYIELFNYLNVTRADIVYEAGYDSVPEQIKLGIMQHVSALYKNRESEVSSHLSEVKKVYSPFREVRVVL